MNKKINFTLITAASIWIYSSNLSQARADDNLISMQDIFNRAKSTTIDSSAYFGNTTHEGPFQDDIEKIQFEGSVAMKKYSASLATTALSMIPIADDEFSKATFYSSQANQFQGVKYLKVTNGINNLFNRYVTASQNDYQVMRLGKSAADPYSDQYSKSQYIREQSLAIDNIRGAANSIKSMYEEISAYATEFSNASDNQKDYLNSLANSSIRAAYNDESDDEFDDYVQPSSEIQSDFIDTNSSNSSSVYNSMNSSNTISFASPSTVSSYPKNINRNDNNFNNESNQLTVRITAIKKNIDKTKRKMTKIKRSMKNEANSHKVKIYKQKLKNTKIRYAKLKKELSRLSAKIDDIR